ncbi:glutathione S-transferase family protein [Fulvimarina sp. MAC8]|uniref:glutathione S-transferase family protein n=1 Tax=Fulvimarina sp. MAC8 TaxID=3162874 RepID=UPI0032EFDE75
MQVKPKLFGASYSVYVRIVRLALLEKAVPYDLIPVDVFASGGPSADHFERHPFGRIPAFEHSGLRLYETGAITRYVDEAFDGPALQPVEPVDRARCNQIISIADNYCYPHLVWGIYVELVSKVRQGEASDALRVKSAIAGARTCLHAMEDLIGDNRWLSGASVSLADLYAAPMLDYFMQASEGRELLLECPRLSAWWPRMTERRSMQLTAPESTSSSP